MTGDADPTTTGSGRRRAGGWLRLLLKPPLVVLVALYFVVDDIVLAAVRPAIARLAALRLFERMSAFIHTLAPYPTLLLFAVPFAILEPPKLIAVYLMGTGRFRAGLILLTISHLASIVIVERLFHVTRDKLLMIPWFARGYAAVLRLRDWALTIVRATTVWQTAVAWARAARQAAHALAATFGPPLRRLGAQGFALLRRLFLHVRRAARR